MCKAHLSKISVRKCTTQLFITTDESCVGPPPLCSSYIDDVISVGAENKEGKGV